METRCIMCGRVIEIESFIKDPYDDDDMPKKKAVSFCQLCEAKLRYESDESQKVPKPV